MLGVTLPCQRLRRLTGAAKPAPGWTETLVVSDRQPPLQRYMTALEAIAASGAGLTVSEVAERCALPIATAHRLLQTMQGAGLVTSEGGRRKTYRIGQRLLRLLHSSHDSGWVQIAVQPILAELADELSETCFVTRLVDRNVVSLAWAAPTHGLQGYVVPGHVMPPHAAASAKAVLAFQTAELVASLLGEPLPGYTSETKTSRAEIEREYADIRSRHYATCWNEIEIGLGAVAIPIPLPGIGIVYALAVSGLIDRIASRPVETTVAILKGRIGALTRALATHG